VKQITNIKIGNWNIFLDDKGWFWSITKKGEKYKGCKDSFFCSDIKYIISVIYKYNSFKIEDFTEYGLSLIDAYLKEHNCTRIDLFKVI